jgi:hypothetical protein
MEEATFGRPASHDEMPRIRNLLAQLSADPTNIVFVVSGRTQEDLDELFPVSQFPTLGLAAEHGIWIRWPKIEQDTPQARHLTQEPSTENFSSYYQQASMKSSKSMSAIAGGGPNMPTKIRKGLSRTDLSDMNFSHTSSATPSNKVRRVFLCTSSVPRLLDSVLHVCDLCIVSAPSSSAIAMQLLIAAILSLVSITAPTFFSEEVAFVLVSRSLFSNEY